MRTSSIFVKSRTKTFTRTKVAEPVIFAPGGLFKQHPSLQTFFYFFDVFREREGDTLSWSRKPSFPEFRPRSFSQFACRDRKPLPHHTRTYQNWSLSAFILCRCTINWWLKQGASCGRALEQRSAKFLSLHIPFLLWMQDLYFVHILVWFCIFSLVFL